MNLMLFTWTIFETPRDFPGKFVVRSFATNAAPPYDPIPAPHPAAVVDTLEEARAALPPGLAMIPRSPEDDAVIVETWL